MFLPWGTSVKNVLVIFLINKGCQEEFRHILYHKAEWIEVIEISALCTNGPSNNEATLTLE